MTVLAQTASHERATVSFNDLRNLDHERPLEKTGGLQGIAVRAAVRLSHDLIDDPHAATVDGRQSECADDLIRRQMGREFSNSLADVKDAKLAAFRQERKTVADSLGDLENRMDLLRTEVESAPAASTIISAKGFPTKRISRMVSFEEDMLRQARNLSIRSQTAKDHAVNQVWAEEDVDALRTGLDNFQRTFSKRLGLLEGFKEL